MPPVPFLAGQLHVAVSMDVGAPRMPRCGGWSPFGAIHSESRPAILDHCGRRTSGGRVCAKRIGRPAPFGGRVPRLLTHLLGHPTSPCTCLDWPEVAEGQSVICPNMRAPGYSLFCSAVFCRRAPENKRFGSECSAASHATKTQASAHSCPNMYMPFFAIGAQPPIGEGRTVMGEFSLAFRRRGVLYSFASYHGLT